MSATEGAHVQDIPSASRQSARRLRIGLASVATLLMATGIAACGDDDSDGGSDSLTVYSGREEEYVGPIFDQLEEATGIDAEIRYGDSAELAATIAEEGENSPADVFFSQDAGSLGAVEAEGLFAALPDEVLDRVAPRYRSAEGEWVGTSGRARVVGYNTEAVSEDELPDSISGFTDPAWKGRIGWAPTNGSFQASVTAMRLTEGEDAAREWVEGIVANDPEVFTDNEAIRDAIASGEIDAGFLNHYYVAEAQAEEGADYPVDIHFTSDDAGSLVNVAGIGVLASSENQETAHEFAEYVLSEEAQRHFADVVKEYPLAAGARPDPLLVPLDEIPQPNVDLAELTDLDGTLTLLQEAGAL
jgi:iron(III) transport system substrate-binding protein